MHFRNFSLGSKYRMLFFFLEIFGGRGLDIMPDITHIFFLVNRRYWVQAYFGRKIESTPNGDAVDCTIYEG